MLPVGKYTALVLLPLILTYFLAFLRMVERRLNFHQERPTVFSFLSVRDAALVTLGLDISALVQAASSVLLAKSQFSLFPLVTISSSLLLVHLSLFLRTVLLHKRRGKDYPSNFIQGVTDATVAMTILMTNATTIIGLLQATMDGLLL